MIFEFIKLVLIDRFEVLLSLKVLLAQTLDRLQHIRLQLEYLFGRFHSILCKFVVLIITANFVWSIGVESKGCHLPSSSL